MTPDPIKVEVRSLMRATGQNLRQAQEAVAALHGYETYNLLRKAIPAVRPGKRSAAPRQPKAPYRAPVREVEPVDGPVPVSMRALVFFSSCPEIEMSTTDMRIKFGLSRRVSLNRYLDPLLKRGLVSRRVTKNTSFYSAGPQLLAELGEEQDDAEAAVQARWAGHDRTAVDVHEDGMQHARPAWIPRGIE